MGAPHSISHLTSLHMHLQDESRTRTSADRSRPCGGYDAIEKSIFMRMLMVMRCFTIGRVSASIAMALSISPLISRPPYSKATLLSASCFLVSVTDFMLVDGALSALPIALPIVIIFLFLMLGLLRLQRPISKRPASVPESVLNVLEPIDSYEMNGALVVVGRLKMDANEAFESLRGAFRGVRTPILQGTEDRAVVILSPTDLELMYPRTATRPVIHIMLAVLTLITTTAAGARLASGNWLVGLTYSLPLLLILGLHELGHFVAARLHKISVTPPFFVPIPFGLGTFGAFIQLRSPAVDRKGLFDVAISGPLAGFIVAVPTLLIGLQTSIILHPAHPITRMGSFWQGVPASSSLLFSFLFNLIRPGELQFGDLVQLSPLAFAGWIGIWVTALNLIPLGQLDGGHAAHGLLGGRRIGQLNQLTYLALFIGGILYWPGLITWALLVYFLAGQSVPPLNDITPVDGKRKLIALCAFAIVLLTFHPVSP